MTQDKIIDTDVLVIGGGLAGIQAAIKAKDLVPRVTLADKAFVSRSGGTVFCHVCFAPTPPDQLRDWIGELALRAKFLCDQEWTEVMMKEEGDRIRDMVAWGVPFERDAEGNLKLERGRGQEITQNVLYEGRPMMEAMRKHALGKGVHIADRVAITDLLTSDGQLPTEGRVVGAVGLETRTGEFRIYRAKTVVLATGAISTKLHCLNIDNNTGDGQAMAYRCGADLQGMELVMTPMFSVWERRFYTHGQSQFQCYGATIVNALGERIMDKYVPSDREPLSDLGIIGHTLAKEILEGRGPIYVDMRCWDDEQINKLRKVLPMCMRAFDEAGVDLQKQLVEATPLTAAWGAGGEGGIKIDLECRTRVPGLFAAGVAAEIAGCIAGVVGVEQTFCNVSGHRAGQGAAKLARSLDEVRINQNQLDNLKELTFYPMNKKNGIKPDDIYFAINKTVVPAEYSIFKHEKRIKEVLQEVRRIAAKELPLVTAEDPHELVKANEARSFVTLAELVYLSALERKESRLSHNREDYPYKDDIDWLKWVIVNRGKEGPTVRTEPLPIERYPVKPPTRERVPAPVQFSFREES